MKRGVKKAFAVFFAGATLITFSSTAVRADEAAAIPSAGLFAQAFLGGNAPGFLPFGGPLFGFPVSLNNLTWGNYADSDSPSGSEGDYASISNLTWGNYSSKETNPEPNPEAP